VNILGNIIGKGRKGNKMERLTGINRTRCDISDADAWDKLAEYEELEEQGLLLRLPCKAGDILYSYSIIEKDTFEFEILEILYNIVAEKHGVFIRRKIYGVVGNVYTSFDFDDIGKTVFLTREQAEQKLKELQEGEKE